MVLVIHIQDEMVASNRSFTERATGDGSSTYASISDEASLIFQWVNHAVVCQVIDVFGVVFNIINIICFVKQGFNDPVNVSLLGTGFVSLLVAVECCICSYVFLILHI